MKENSIFWPMLEVAKAKTTTREQRDILISACAKLYLSTRKVA